MIVQMGHFEGEVVSTMLGFLPLLNAFRSGLAGVCDNRFSSSEGGGGGAHVYVCMCRGVVLWG